GLAVREDFQQLAGLSPEGGAAAVDALLGVPEPPTAVVVASEAQAIGALVATRRAGRRVPGDVSLVGYNDNDVARFLGLTTVSVPLRQLGHRAAERLFALVADPELPPQATYLPSELTVRSTCAAPPRAA